MNTVIYIGIDVHKDSYSLCAYHFKNNQAFAQMKIESKDNLVVKYVHRLVGEHEDIEILCGYEAGPSGFGLYRHLQCAGIPCVLMAPTSLP